MNAKFVVLIALFPLTFLFSKTMGDWSMVTDNQKIEFQDSISKQTPIISTCDSLTIVQVEQDQAIFTIVEHMPCFPACDNSKLPIGSCCNKDSLFKFINDHMVYPKKIKEGEIYISFVVTAAGCLYDIQIVKDEVGLGEEILRIFSLMPNWVPGYQRRKPLHVRYVLPIQFSL